MPSPAASQTIRPSAMRDLFAAHHGWLLARLRARLPDTADAQDVAAETFLRLLAGRERGQAATEELREPRALLTTIAKRLLYTLWHRRELERACLEVMAAQGEALAPSPEERALLLETLEHIAHALEGLPAQAQQAFLLSQIDGRPYHAIADRLGISLSTVRRHMAEGFRRLALAMARQEAGIALPARRAAEAP